MIENHILAKYFEARLDQLGLKIAAIAQAMGISGFIPEQFALQVPIKEFAYTAPTEGAEGYLKATVEIMPFPATCFGGMMVVEKNVEWISELDPDDCDGVAIKEAVKAPAKPAKKAPLKALKALRADELPTYTPFECGPGSIPVSHPMFARADIKILDNAVAIDENGDRNPCPNIHEIGKSYKEDTLPIWIRPTPMTDAEALLTELASDEEAADPPAEAECRKYFVEVFVLEQQMADGMPIRDLSQWIDGSDSLLKADVVLNGYLLYKPSCRMKLFCTEPLFPPVTPPCDIIADILDKVQKQY